MPSILDDYSGGSSEFPLPNDPDTGRPQDPPSPEAQEALAPKEKIEIKVNGDFEIGSLRGKAGIGPKQKTVINLKGKCINNAKDYAGSGEVGLWFEPDKVGNPNNPQRSRAAEIVNLFVNVIGCADASDFDDLDGHELLAKMAQVADEYQGSFTMKACLYWGWRAWQGEDKVMVSYDNDFRWIVASKFEPELPY